MKLAVLTNILSPCRVPLFEAMRRRVEEFTVLLMAEHEENRLWKIGMYGFNAKVLPGIHFRPRRSDVSMHVNYGVLSSLRRLDPDIVVSAGFTIANVAALLYCKLFKKTYVQWAHLTLRDGAHASATKRALRRWMTRLSDGSIGESSEAREAFLHYGARPDRVFTTLMPFEASGLHDRAVLFKCSPEYRSLRADFPGPVLLSIGQLINRKGYQELFGIYDLVLAARPETSLVIVGEGGGRPRYESDVRARGWKHVRFTGYVQAEELPRYLALADVFVFHTLYDPFGLVLSEAMAAELPVVSSVHASSTRDLVQDGVTGFRIDPRETRSSAETILRALDMPASRRAEMGKAAYRLVARCDIEPSAEAIVGFLEGVSRVGKASRGR